MSALPRPVPDGAAGIARMSIREFRESGFLQEVNRLLLHPLGLALETVEGADGEECLGGVWDYRSNPGGLWFAPADLDPDAADRVERIRVEHAAIRREIFGEEIQPV